MDPRTALIMMNDAVCIEYKEVVNVKCSTEALRWLNLLLSLSVLEKNNNTHFLHTAGRLEGPSLHLLVPDLFSLLYFTGVHSSSQLRNEAPINIYITSQPRFSE